MYTKSVVVELIKNGPMQHVAQLLICLYQRQTSDEQSSENTRHQNSRGFNSFDAQFMTSVAQNAIKHGSRLTPGQLPHVRKALVKYSAQLLDALNSKEVILTPIEPARPQQNQRQPQPSPIRTSSAISEDEWQSILSQER